MNGLPGHADFGPPPGYQPILSAGRVHFQVSAAVDTSSNARSRNAFGGWTRFGIFRRRTILRQSPAAKEDVAPEVSDRSAGARELPNMQAWVN